METSTSVRAVRFGTSTGARPRAVALAHAAASGFLAARSMTARVPMAAGASAGVARDLAAARSASRGSPG